jgi:hypothetical protein
VDTCIYIVIMVNRTIRIVSCYTCLSPRVSYSEVFNYYLLVSNFSFDCRSSTPAVQRKRTTLLLFAAIKQNKQTTNTTKNNTPNKRDALKKSALNVTVRCYDHESARTTKNEAIVTEDTSVEVYNITEMINYMLDLF